jgi:hypothetical protein
MTGAWCHAGRGGGPGERRFEEGSGSRRERVNVGTDPPAPRLPTFGIHDEVNVGADPPARRFRR